MRIVCFFVLFLFMGRHAFGQSLQPGFDQQEYMELMKVSALTTADTGYSNKLPPPRLFSRVYRSPVLGLDNLWDLWTDGRGVAAISIRGTTRNQASWLENFYAGMVPAKGQLQLAKNETFSYELTAQPRAAVHAGWLVGMAFLAKDMLPKIDSAYHAGTRNILLIGHSQGGAIAYLLTAWWYQMQQSGRLPADLRLKTYCSAAPKPGNLPFAYAYEAMTAGGWAFNVVNSADWVPETPVSIQTLDDFNNTNPFVGAKSGIRKLGFPANLALGHVYNRLTKSARKARNTYQRYLGNLTGKRVGKQLAGFKRPGLYNSNHYVRTGNFVVLLADSTYFTRFPDTTSNVFIHHLHAPYLYLTEKKLGTGTTMNQQHALDGNWELTHVEGTALSVAEQFPAQKPAISFDVADGRISGTTGCNRFNGQLTLKGTEIRLQDALPTTRRMCLGTGEQHFLEKLQQVKSFALQGAGTLVLLSGNLELMRLVRR